MSNKSHTKQYDMLTKDCRKPGEGENTQMSLRRNSTDCTTRENMFYRFSLLQSIIIQIKHQVNKSSPRKPRKTRPIPREAEFIIQEVQFSMESYESAKQTLKSNPNTGKTIDDRNLLLENPNDGLIKDFKAGIINMFKELNTANFED